MVIRTGAPAVLSLVVLGTVVLAPESISNQDRQPGSCWGIGPTSPIDLLLSCARDGDAQAQTSLGIMYDNGEGAPEDDAEAVRWYRLAAEQGHVLAQSNLGLMYDKGEGVPKDDAEAVRWYRLAAEQGYAQGQYNLGVKYDTGEGVPEDDAEAARWYRLSAEQG